MGYLSENMKTVGKILFFMYAVTAVLLFLLAALVQKIELREGVISIGISIIYVLTCFLGGFLTGKVKKKRKFLWGLLLGSLYVLVMVGITLVMKKGFDGSFATILVNLLLCIGGGMLGGMVS